MRQLSENTFLVIESAVLVGGLVTGAVKASLAAFEVVHAGAKGLMPAVRALEANPKAREVMSTAEGATHEVLFGGGLTAAGLILYGAARRDGNGGPSRRSSHESSGDPGDPGDPLDPLDPLDALETAINLIRDLDPANIGLRRLPRGFDTVPVHPNPERRVLENRSFGKRVVGVAQAVSVKSDPDGTGFVVRNNSLVGIYYVRVRGALNPAGTSPMQSDMSLQRIGRHEVGYLTVADVNEAIREGPFTVTCRADGLDEEIAWKIVDNTVTSVTYGGREVADLGQDLGQDAGAEL